MFISLTGHAAERAEENGDAPQDVDGDGQDTNKDKDKGKGRKARKETAK